MTEVCIVQRYHTIPTILNYIAIDGGGTNPRSAFYLKVVIAVNIFYCHIKTFFIWLFLVDAYYDLSTIKHLLLSIYHKKYYSKYIL